MLSAAGALEGQWFKIKKSLYNISAQNLLDCANATYGSYGCVGGYNLKNMILLITIF